MRECASEAGERMVLPKMGAGMLAGSGGGGGSGPATCVEVVVVKCRRWVCRREPLDWLVKNIAQHEDMGLEVQKKGRR